MFSLKSFLKEKQEKEITIALKELKIKQFQEKLKDKNYMDAVINEVAAWFI
jgi:hypothetical protein